MWIMLFIDNSGKLDWRLFPSKDAAVAARGELRKGAVAKDIIFRLDPASVVVE